MDSTRISLARILAANVPLTWQDAVAVVQEVAMVSDVNAAMNSHPSLVTAASCFVTTDGEVDLPDSTSDEQPEAVASLLRDMLRGRDAPPALQSLARRRFADDLFGELAAFSDGPRRPVIAALATRALAAGAAPAEPVMPPVVAAPAPLPAMPPVAERPPFVPAGTVAAAAPPFRAVADPPRPVQQPMPPPFVATPQAVALAPPFRAAGPAFDASAGDAASPELELRRLRARTLDKEQGASHWSARVAAWLSWRPAFADPRVLGGAVIVIAAVGSLLWRDASPAATRPASPLVATAPAPTASAPAEPPATTSSTPSSVPSAALPTSTAPPRRPAAVALPAPPVTATTPASPGVSTDTRHSAEPSAPLNAVTPPPAPPASASGATSIVIPALESPRPAARPAGRDSARSRTSYSAQDTNVVPPVMLRQQLPSPLLEPGAEVLPGGPYLELMVDEQGAVEQVRLRARQPAPGQTWYRHRMLLAAAKAWQFEPARLDGQPVRYVMRVPLEP